MKTAFYILLTVIKAGVIFFFAARIVRTFSKKDPEAKGKALIQFFIMCGVLIAVTALEFGIAFLLDMDG